MRETLEAAGEQLARAREATDRRREEIAQARRELWENADRGITNLWNADDFEALAELNQGLAPIAELAADCMENERKIRRLELLVQSPYFAGMDFCFEEGGEAERIYIGRTALMEKRAAKIYVYDWRSPIAGVFYRFLPGEAFYDAPGGRITGSLQRKRQYEIKNGILLSYFETDINIGDEILRRQLSENASPRMKAIVETIQREQDAVIRNRDSDLLMIQGAAGSGKTSVALHRAAFLMYRGLERSLSAGSILILSPNGAFEEYISDVLPQLGEDNVATEVFEELMGSLLEGQSIQPQREFLEMALGEGSGGIRKKSIGFKTSEAFMEALDGLAAQMPLETGAQDAAGERLRRLREGYRALWTEESGLMFRLPEGISWEDIREIREYTLGNLEAEVLRFDDALALLYGYVKAWGSGINRGLRQVMVDEAQDYYPLQYAVLRLLFPCAKFTVLGDVNQALTKREDLSFYGGLQRLLGKKSASLVKLNKSFRCTREILRFSLGILSRNNGEVQSFNRSGEPVAAEAFDSREAYLDRIVGEVQEGLRRGYETVCLICKTEENCRRLHGELCLRMELRPVGEAGEGTLRGIFMLPSYMAKGLEFDAVIVCDADSANYSREWDRRILYVECTRALHRLSLFCQGEMSPLI